MIIDLTKLNNELIKEIKINEKININKEVLKNINLLDLKNVLVNGIITKSSLDYKLIFEISGEMIIPCAITLKPVEQSFLIKIDANLNEISEEFDKNIKIDENTLDIFPIIWENILVEIPMKVVSQDVIYDNLKGDGWKFVSELKSEKQINPELEKLKDLL